MKRIWYLFFIVVVILGSCKSKTDEQLEEQGFLMPDVSLTEQEITNGILTPEILWKFGRVSDPQLSPDGNTLIYNITYYNVEENRGYTHIFSIPTQGGDAKQITIGNYSCFNPRWILEGKKIAYLSSQTDTVQVWTMNADGSEKAKISNLDISINAFKVAPTGDKILLTSDVKLDKAPTEIYEDLPKVDVIMAEELMYRHWNNWHDYAYSHIFVADFDGNSVEAPKDIMEGERWDAPMSAYFDDSEICWSPDGNKIAYTCKKMNGKEYALSTDSDIYIYDIHTGNTSNITKGMLGYDKYPVFSPDSKMISWTSMETPGYEADKLRLFIMDFETGAKTNLTKDFDYNVSNVVWPTENETSENIYFISDINATQQIFGINTKTKEVVQITEGTHDIFAMFYNKDSFIIQKMSMSMATEIFELSKESEQRQITFTNKHIYDNIEMGKVVERWITTTDGKQMLVWLILPPKFDATKEYPAILYCQGGPQSAVSQFFSYRWNFQIMASNGYVVIAPNRRGLPGFGTEWNAQISGDYGGQNMKDYMSAVNTFKNEPYIDKDRIGAVGASYGGFSVFWLAGHNEDNTFKAFISHCGMFNFESQYAATEEMFFVNHDFGGAYWEKENKIAQKTYENSPHNFVHKWNAPILIITGGYDFRIPYTESLQAFNAAQLNGVESKLLIFPEESHFVLKPQNSILWQREFKAWLDKYLK
ncbi:MAG: S9 family peptidase [Bacteroidales bacterium]|nr:S9 family peptidase [Bacteroidales bacterium]